MTFSPADPGWSHSGSITAPLHNVGGRVGAWLADVLLYLAGYVAFLLPVMLGVRRVDRVVRHGLPMATATPTSGRPCAWSASSASWCPRPACCTCASAPPPISPRAAAASSGNWSAARSITGSGPVGGNLFLLALLLVSVTLATGLSWLAVMDRIGQGVLALGPLFRRSTQQASEWQQARAMREEREEVRKFDSELRAKRAPVKIEPPAPALVEKSDRAKREQQIPLFHVGDGSGIPPLALLDDPKPQQKGYSEETLETLSRQIEFKLKDFRIDAQVVGAYPGPVITRFEMEPAPGVKVSQISSLDKDIARGLSASRRCAWST